MQTHYDWGAMKTHTAIQSVSGLPVQGRAPSLSCAEQQEVTSSRPRGRFSNSRTLRAVCEGMAGAAINKVQEQQREKQRDDVYGEISTVRIYTLYS